MHFCPLTQDAPLSLIENWKMELDNKWYGGAILMDLSKAFETFNRDLFIAKLHVFRFSKELLKLIKSYLTNRWQRTKLNTGFSKRTDKLLRVSQGFVLELFLFNICIKDLFFLAQNTNVCNYADSTPFYTCDSDLHSLILRLGHESILAIDWFQSN